MEQYECSVVIVQYNPVWEKVKRTLNSVINQKKCNFEIIVADDGSENTHFDKVIAYLEENDFHRYQLVDNKKNAGTVRNVISGIKVATGKYVRVIAPGDMLYSDNTLSKIVNFMDDHKAKEAFGKMAFYEQKDKEIDIIPLQIPFDFSPYIRKHHKKIKKHLLLLGDNISGASYTWEREYYLECLMRISERVVYLEDCVNAYTVYDGYDICFMDEFVTWYEYGTGISTSKNKKWTAILIKDWISFLKEMGQRYQNDSYVRKASLYYWMSGQGVIYNKFIKNILFLERYLYSKFKAKVIKDEEYRNIEKENALKNF